MELLDGWKPANIMIKQDHLKYQYYGAEIPEVLFDLANDPGETVNVADSPEHSDSIDRFRQRLSVLGHGPNANKRYTNAGYQRSSNVGWGREQT